ncbi:hypothetical protein SKAU_G00276870 [Synaphobranchus kaupii]|uniref:Reverse transcriptase/retrotransposon-derived protein RNase H-like domain-containing protein n=1 Tax=Synaphobranchus kaupii TaxID=118154 RepID=A0A9Q1F1F0_SYNKA|nr:hypothetical protein SKAU_G00276870 [Synaphobranchus kaupii]
MAIFQRFMDTLLAGITGVQPYLYDILITGKTVEEHNARLRTVLKRFAETATWQWTDTHEAAYARAKELLQADDVLAHFDEKKPLAVVCDASPYGLGALLFHMEPDGQEGGPHLLRVPDTDLHREELCTN